MCEHNTANVSSTFYSHVNLPLRLERQPPFPLLLQTCLANTNTHQAHLWAKSHLPSRWNGPDMLPDLLCPFEISRKQQDHPGQRTASSLSQPARVGGHAAGGASIRSVYRRRG